MRVRPVELPTDRPGLIEFLHRRGDGLSENKHAFVTRPDGREGAGMVAETEDGIAGYVGLAPAREREWAMELVSLPTATSSLVRAALATVRERDGRRLRWWVYDSSLEELPPIHGFRAERELLSMGRRLPVPRSLRRTGISSTGFRPGVDEEAWLEVNNEAFAGHPENGAQTLGDLQRRMEMDWFDADGLRMAWEGGRLAGFCWTKDHGDGQGEIYIIAVHPDFQGRGLGEVLVIDGMRHLTRVGCERVFLYTEGDNHAAIRLYERLGFEVERVHRSFIRDLEG